MVLFTVWSTPTDVTYTLDVSANTLQGEVTKKNTTKQLHNLEINMWISSVLSWLHEQTSTTPFCCQLGGLFEPCCIWFMGQLGSLMKLYNLDNNLERTSTGSIKFLNIIIWNLEIKSKCSHNTMDQGPSTSSTTWVKRTIHSNNNNKKYN